MDILTFLLFALGSLAVVMWQDREHRRDTQALRNSVAKLTDERNDLLDDVGDLEDEVVALKAEVEELEDTEIEVDFAWEEDDE